jgi:putative DNA primase/helicase
MNSLTVREIVAVLGGDVTGRNSCNVPGPGHSKIDRSLSITIDGDRFILHSHAGDDWKVCKDYVREGLGLDRWERGNGRRSTFVVINTTASHYAVDDDKEKKKAWALRIWSQSLDPAGTIVEHYLREHRGLALGADIAGSVIRFHSALKFDEFNRRPGMVCLLRDIVTDEPCGIHRTFLDRETGQKLDRKMLGIAKGAAIKLDPQAAISTTLTIGEGVETVLTGRVSGLGPAWALGSSGAVRFFPALSGLTEITILEENDPTSRRDVRECAKRYLAAGKPVNIITPNIGNDLNDAWRAAQ